MTNFYDYADISFLVVYAALSLFTFAVLHHLLVPIYGQHSVADADLETLGLPSNERR